jgi:hypothetical protein
MGLFHKGRAASATAVLPPAPASGPSIADAAIPAPLVSLVKSARISLDKRGLTGQRAAVYLVVDRSGSMASYYRDGSVQHLAEQALALSANLDDDGIVPLVFFDNITYSPAEIDLRSYSGAVTHHHQRLGGDRTMGGTRYEAAMDTVVAHYQATQPKVPALVIFQTDGQPQDREAAADALRRYSSLPVFWSFVGFGPSSVRFLEKLDDLSGRAVDNASYFHAGRDPLGISDIDLYDALTAEFGPWLAAAHAAGIHP